MKRDMQLDLLYEALSWADRSVQSARLARGRLTGDIAKQAQLIEAEERLEIASSTVAQIAEKISSRIRSNPPGHVLPDVVLH